MFIPVENGLIQLVLEPRYQGIASESLITVRVSDFETFDSLNVYPNGTFLLDYRDDLFPLTCFLYEEELIEAVRTPLVLSQIPLLPDDFSRPPKCWKWVRWIDAKKKSSTFECDSYVGFSFIDEIAEDRHLYSTEDDRFLVYPQWEWPKDVSEITHYTWDQSEPEER